MSYKIKQLAEMAGISVRTLHYYDEIGLLKPSGKAENGYRYYEKPELLRLQQILFYRELDLPLEEIKRLLDDQGFDATKALREHKRLIGLKRRRLDKLIITIDNTIKNMKKDNIRDEELYDPFRDDDLKKYQSETKLRWGNTDAYKQSMARVKKMTKTEMEKLKEEGRAFTRKLADSMGKEPGSGEVQELVEEHYKGIQFFYDCPAEMYRKLGRMYVNDPRFTAYYDRFRPGLAAFLRDAIEIFCDRKDK